MSGPRAKSKPTPLGRAVRELGLSSKEVASRLGVSYQTVWKIIYWKGYRPRRPVLEGLRKLGGWPLSTLLDWCGSERRFDECKDCGREVLRRPSARKNKTRLCQTCWQRSRQVAVTCGLCGRGFRRGKRLAARSKIQLHFCSREHWYEWRKGKRHPQRLRGHRGGAIRGREAARFKAARVQPSYQRQAAMARLSPSTINLLHRGLRKQSRLRPFTRYCLVKANVPGVTAHDENPFTSIIFAFCFENRMTPADLWRRAGLNPWGSPRTLRSNPAATTVDAVATAMALVAGDDAADLSKRLQTLRDTTRHRSPKQLTSVLYRNQKQGGRRASIDKIVRIVLAEHPSAREKPLRQYLVRLERGRGRPRNFTDSEARAVFRQRDAKKMSWARIGDRMGWPVIKSATGYPSDCRRARNAYRRGKALTSG